MAGSVAYMGTGAEYAKVGQEMLKVCLVVECHGDS